MSTTVNRAAKAASHAVDQIQTQEPAPVSARPQGPAAVATVPHPELRCPGCQAPEAKLQVYDSVRRGTSRVRYHRCRVCGRNFKTVATAA